MIKTVGFYLKTRLYIHSRRSLTVVDGFSDVYPVRCELAAPECVLPDRRRPLSPRHSRPGLFPEALRRVRRVSRDRHVLGRLQPGRLRLAQLQHPQGVVTDSAVPMRRPGRGVPGGPSQDAPSRCQDSVG